MSTPRFLRTPVNFYKIGFFDPCTSSMRKVDNGGKNILFRGFTCCSGELYAVQEGYMDAQEGYMLKKIMMFLVATNVVASRPQTWK